MPIFIQFIHNGKEPIAARSTGESWNKGRHCRKFLRSSGSRLDENGRKVDGQTLFWGEWEPESRIVKRIEKPIKKGPNYIYEPYYLCPHSYEDLQNTDPFVFGDHFRYSWCQQPSHISLRSLEQGCVILFGSPTKEGFALDTVFVVLDYTKYMLNDYEALLRQIDETYRVVTMNPILKEKTSAYHETCTSQADSKVYRSYRGATTDDNVNGMFSFFPCQAYTEDSLGFARPIIQMPAVRDNLPRGIKITQCKNLDQVKNHWDEVIRQVTKTCSLGIFAEMPRKSKPD